MWTAVIGLLANVVGPLISWFKGRSDLNNTPEEKTNVEAQRLTQDHAKNQQAVQDDLKDAPP